jgi:tetratricopeptide (TPR) repeat protein
MGSAQSFSQIRAALDQGDYQTAHALSAQATQEMPDKGEGWILLGHALGQEIDHVGFLRKPGMARQIVASYERAFALDPHNLEANNSLIEFYRQAPEMVGGGRAKALTQIKRVLEFDPIEGTLWTGRMAAYDGKWPEAFAAVDSAHNQEPDSYRANYWLGYLCATAGKRLDEGERALRKAILLQPNESDPGLAKAYLRLGEILEKEQNVADAKRAYEQALQLDPKLKDVPKKLKP